jgi:hypothetical protein
MKLKKIRNALLVVLSLALVSAATVAITWAAATQNKLDDKKDNTFTNNPNIAVSIKEDTFDGLDWDEPRQDDGEPKDANVSSDSALGFNIAQSYSPGTNVPKNPKLKNSTKTAASQFVTSGHYKPSTVTSNEWVAMTLKYTLTLPNDVYVVDTNDANADNNGLTSTAPIPLKKDTTMSEKVITFDSYDDFKTAIASVYTSEGLEFNTTYWKDISSDSSKTIWMYKSKLEQGAETSALFNSVKIRSNDEDFKPYYVTINGAATQLYPVRLKYTENDAAVDKTVYISTPPTFEIDLAGYAIQADAVEDDDTDNGAPAILRGFIASKNS